MSSVTCSGYYDSIILHSHLIDGALFPVFATSKSDDVLGYFDFHTSYYASTDGGTEVSSLVVSELDRVDEQHPEENLRHRSRMKSTKIIYLTTDIIA